MHKLSILLTFSFFYSCQAQQTDFEYEEKSEKFIEQGIEYSPTILPIRLEKLNSEQTSIIQKLNDADTSSYYIQSRPVIFQIVNVVNNDDQTRYTLRINQAVEVFIYALGEAHDSTLVDFGWIENEENEIVWKMKYNSSTYAGGDKRNRKCADKIILKPGTYRLRYVSNSNHASDDWEGHKPENDFNYGITVFNMNAIKRIKELFNNN